MRPFIHTRVHANLPVRVDGVDVGPCAQKQLAQPLLIVLRGNDERCIVVLVSAVHRYLLPVDFGEQDSIAFLMLANQEDSIRT